MIFLAAAFMLCALLMLFLSTWHVHRRDLNLFLSALLNTAPYLSLYYGAGQLFYGSPVLACLSFLSTILISGIIFVLVRKMPLPSYMIKPPPRIEPD
ncbi:MAG: hypothetical protein ACAH95_09290 [Fimbriimonas sp.]